MRLIRCEIRYLSFKTGIVFFHKAPLPIAGKHADALRSGLLHVVLWEGRSYIIAIGLVEYSDWLVEYEDCPYESCLVVVECGLDLL